MRIIKIKSRLKKNLDKDLLTNLSSFLYKKTNTITKKL